MQPRDDASETTPLTEAPTLWSRKYVLVLVLCSYNCLMWGMFYTVMVPLMPHYGLKYGIGEIMQAVILGSLQLGWFVGLPFVNFAPLSGRSMVLLGCVCYTVAPGMVALEPGLESMLAARVIEGFGSCLLNITMTSVMTREVPPVLHGRAFAVRNMVLATGLFTGPVVGGLLYTIGGIRLPMAAIFAVGVIGLLAYLLLMPNDWFASREALVAESGSQARHAVQNFSALLRNRLFLQLMCVHSLSWSLVGVLLVLVPKFVALELHVTALETSLLWLSWDATQLVTTAAGGKLADTVHPWSPFFLGISLQQALLFALGVITLPSSPLQSHTGVVFFLVTMSIFGLGTTDEGLLGPLFLKLLTSMEREMGSKRFEEVFSIKEFACALALLLGPLYAGAASKAVGTASAIFAFAILSSVANAACMLGSHGLREIDAALEGGP